MSKPLSYFSVCSGVEAATSALHPLGFLPMGFAEIDKAASRVLAFHHGSNMPGLPLSRNGVPNFGDLTTINPEDVPPVDWLIGGTPCQGFSVAGARGSLKDARSNLALAYVVLAHELVRSCGLKGCLWENVPGVLSTDDNAFGCFLGGLIGADDALLPCPKPPDGRTNDFWNWKQRKDTGFWFHAPTWPSSGMVAGPRARLAWRVLDAQHFGLAQRRARVFVVADFGDGPDPAKVLFERKSVRGNPTPRRGAREEVAGTLSARTEGGGGLGTDFEVDGGIQPVAFGGGNRSGPIDSAATLTAKGHKSDFEVETFLVSPPLTGNPYGDHESREGLLVCAGVASTMPSGGNETGGDRPPGMSQESASGYLIAYEEPYTLAIRGRGDGHDLEYRQDGVANALLTPNGGRGGIGVGAVATQWAVRRLTPRECERLQGFSDDFTAVNGQADGPRYKQLGNSFAVNVIAWIGARILAASEG